MKNKWLRMLVCFVLVCGILVNISPIRARSVVVDTAVAVSGVALLTWAYLAAAGVVYIPQSVAQLNAFEKSLDDWWTQNLKTDEDWENYKNYVDYFNGMYLGFWDPDAPRPPKNKLLAGLVGTAMGTALAGFAYSVIKDQEVVEVEEEVAAEEGQQFYGDVSFPVFPDSYVEQYPVMFIIPNTYRNTYELYFIDAPISYDGDEDAYYKEGKGTINGVCYRLSSGGTSWNYYGSGGYACFTTRYGDILWANYGLDLSDGTHLIGTEPSFTSTTTVPVLPDTYIGDIPDQVKNGTLNAESLPLPNTLDLSSIVTSPETALQDVQSLAQQLSNGGVTYNDYITNITYVEDPEPETTEPTQPVPGTGTDPTTPSDSEGEDSGDDSEDEEEKLEELEFYTLDLTEFFPFCIPFDIYEFFSILSATPQAPVFDWPIVVPALGLDYTISVDLSPWNDVAALFRKLELMAFIVGLGFVTRKNFLRG